MQSIGYERPIAVRRGAAPFQSIKRSDPRTVRSLQANTA
jgi:hypothetical protein